MLVPFLIYLGIDLIFVILAIVFLCGKGSFLIAGYNTASVSERAKYDEKALCKAMGKMMLALAVCWFFASLSFLFERMALMWIGMSMLFLVIVVGIISINTSKKIKRK